MVQTLSTIRCGCCEAVVAVEQRYHYWHRCSTAKAGSAALQLRVAAEETYHWR